MKTKIVLAIVLFCSILNFGQKRESIKDIISPTNPIQNRDSTTQIIEYDFVKGVYDKTPNPLLQNIPVVLKIKNINRLFYKPMVEGKDIESNDANLSEVPTKTVLNKLEEYTLTKPETLTFSFAYTLQENNPSSTEIDIKDATEEKKLDGFKKNIDNLKIEISENDALIKKYKDLINLKRNSNIAKSEDKIFPLSKSNPANVVTDKPIVKVDSVTVLQNKIDSLQNKNIDKEKSIFDYNMKYNQTIDNIKATKVLVAQLNDNLILINSKYNSFYEVAIEIQKITNRYNNFIDKINRPDFNEEDYKLVKNNNSHKVESLEKTPIINPDNIKNYYSKISDFENFYNNFVKECNDPKFRNLQQKLYTIKNLQVYLQFIDKDLARLKTSALDIYKNADNSKIYNKLNQVEILDRELSQKENFTYVSDPIQGKGDILEFNVEIKPKNDYKDALSIYQPRKFTYSSNLRGGIRFDFGVGLSIDFKNNNEQFEIQEIFNDTTPQTSVKYLQMINDNKFLPKLVGMFHTSLRSNTNLAFGLSLGTALDVTNFDISSIYLGFSTLIGRKDKLVLTIGPSFMSAQQLKNTYRQYIESNDLKTKLPDVFQLTNDIYTRNYKVGYFLAITYNLTTKQRSTFMSAKP